MPVDDENEFAPRLDMIETEWTMLRNAHQGAFTKTEDSRNSLVLKYAPAIRSYVHALTRSTADADELSQEVIVRLLKGDFGGADPNRGRFRDLLKVAVKNMVRNHWAKQNRRKTVDFDPDLADETEETESVHQWEDTWQKNVLEVAWVNLETFQNQRPGNVFYSALRLRYENSDADSATLAKLLSREHDREITAVSFRQQLRRARVRFAEYVVEEVANGIDSTSPQKIHDELISVGLYEYVKDIVPDDWVAKSICEAGPKKQ